MSSKRTSPHVKHCARIALPTEKEEEEQQQIIQCNPPPPVIIKSVPSGPSPLPCKTFADIPSSDACLKPEFCSLIKPLTKKAKVDSRGSLIKGQLGHVFFSPGFVWNCEEIPIGYSLIMHSFHPPFKFEHAKTRYVITDPFGVKWTSPDTFNLWHECVEAGEAKDIDTKIYRVAVVRHPGCFMLASSLRKNKYNDQIFPVQMPGADQTDPNEMEAFPPDSDEEPFSFSNK